MRLKHHENHAKAAFAFCGNALWSAPTCRQRLSEVPGMRRRLAEGAALVLLLSLVCTVNGLAAADLLTRPKIGVALSGGGARGGAHMGVLQVLETLRVPIDVIVGTSFGALIGGLYASGLSVNAIQQRVLNADLEKKFISDIPRDALSFRRKQDDAELLVKYRLGIKDRKLQFPRGLISGQEFRLWLDEVLFPVRGVNDFDDLPIPFRCVTTDILSGDQLIMAQGDLPTAIYACMAVPGLLPPVEQGARLLVDGGLVNNLPVDVARALGADIVIAVDIGTPFATRDELDSALSILNHLPRLMVRGNTEATLKSLRDDDILIQPALTDIASGNFGQLDEAMIAGRAATRARTDKLKALRLSPRRYAQHLDARPRPATDRPVVDFVRIETTSSYREAYLQSFLRLRPGEVLDPEELEADLREIYALGAFESVDYELVADQGQTGVVIQAIEKRTGRNFLRFGFGIEDNFDNINVYSAAVSYTMTQLNPWGAEWRSELRLGSVRRFFSELYQPLGATSRFFVNPFFEWQQRRVQLYDKGEAIGSEAITTLEAGVGIGRTLGRWGQFSLSYAGGIGREDPDVFDVFDVFEPVDFDVGAFTMSLAVDTLDSLDFPHYGSSALLAWRAGREALGEDDNNDTVLIDWFQANAWGRNTLGTWITAASTLDDQSPSRNDLTAGGFLDLSGFQTDELSGRHLGVARALLYRRLRGGPLASLVNTPIYLGGSLEWGNLWLDSDDITLRHFLLAGSAFFGAETVIGPVFFAGGYAEGGHAAVYLSVGRPFSSELTSSLR